MSVLKNKKWEKFAQEVAKGKSAGTALVASEIERRACIGGALGFYIYVESIYLASGLTEDAAYALESLIIRMAGFEKLTNILPGISTTAQQRALEAKRYLSQVVPFCTWQAGKSAQHIEWYWGIIGELKQIAVGKTIKGIQVACPN